eukprot:CAMPEP_0170576490 /NCGR_PEP_ID=MMETSP0224-20130122/4421_1 /TAXON_ID=285029 /ORGANISM="Togula jolla, Strain CCCM 725" /LENGTH=109 /DNA_ID=CAMNT_0010899337 /DNA_START=61 /DNA_END=390 /DNA_ORIENTATION=-
MKRMRSTSEENMTVFKLFDRDGNGSIDFKELQDKMLELGFMLDVGDLQQMIDDVDENGNGTIEQSEFMKLMRLPQYEAFAMRMLATAPRRDEQDDEEEPAEEPKESETG